MVLCNLFIRKNGEREKKKKKKSTEQNTYSHYSWEVRTVIRAEKLLTPLTEVSGA